MTNKPVRIATRASALALWQANHMADLIRQSAPDRTVELIHVHTKGDRDQTGALRTFGGTGVFTREVQHAVLNDEADLAVHSLKDLPTQTVDGLQLACVPERASVDDALVLPKGTSINSLDELPQGAVIGTGSPRRQAQLKFVRPDLQMQEIRGNVGTRLQKVDDGEFDAIVLAVAGLERLGLAERISLRLCAPTVYPAVGQGALALECRANDTDTARLLNSLTHEPTHAVITAERTLLATLQAGCHAALGVSNSVEGEELTLEGVLLDAEGTERIKQTACGSIKDPQAVGIALANALLKLGGQRLLDQET